MSGGFTRILGCKLIKRAGKLGFKVTEKGGVSVYGLGRFPRPFLTINGQSSLMPERTCELFWRRTRAT